MLPRRFRDSRRLEALLKGRKRKTGRARRCFTNLFYLFRAIFGFELDCGKLWRRKSLGTGVYQPEDPWEVKERLFVHQPEDPWPEDLWEARERLLVYQPEDPWEVRERLFRCFRGVSVTAGGLQRGCRVESGRQGVLDAASQTYFTGSESNVRHSGGTYADVVCVCTVVCVRLHCCVLIASTSIPINLPP